MDRLKPDFHLLRGVGRALGQAISERDHDTGQHCERVLHLSVELAAHLDFSWHELELLALAARFHDLGKIGIPDHILHKPGVFDADERSRMREHAAIGERIVRGVGCDHADEIASAVRHHHEHFDGSGYPDGLAGTAIPVFSRIIALVDSYDAIACQRPYHHSLPHKETMDLLFSESGSKHDPDLLHAFAPVIERTRARQPHQ